MKANPKLIEALRSLANDIESDNSNYSWQHQSTCNCGLLAQKLIGRETKVDTRFGLKSLFDAMIFTGTWTEKACEAQRCGLTGMTMGAVFDLLAAHGVELSDIGGIEYVPQCMDAMETDDLKMVDPLDAWKWYKQPENRITTANHFRALAVKLQAELDAETIQVPVPVQNNPIKLTEKLFGATENKTVQPITIQQQA